MDLDKPAILLVGGGEGMGPVEKTVDGCCYLLLLRPAAACCRAAVWVVWVQSGGGLAVGCVRCICSICLLSCPPPHRPCCTGHRQRVPAGRDLRAQRAAGGAAAEEVRQQLEGRCCRCMLSADVAAAASAALHAVVACRIHVLPHCCPPACLLTCLLATAAGCTPRACMCWSWALSPTCRS